MSPERPTYPEPELRLDGEEAGEVFGAIGATLEADSAGDKRYLDAKKKVADGLSERWPVSRKMAATALTVWILVALPYLHPALRSFRLLGGGASHEKEQAPIAAGGPLPAASVGEAKLPGATYDAQARARELTASDDSRGPIAKTRRDLPAGYCCDGGATDEDKAPRPIDDPSGQALDKLFQKLARVEKKEPGAIARIVYYGDSIVASDFVTGQLRRRLQSRFGDAGHGYALIANAWPGWFHIDVARAASSEWRVSTCVGPYAKDALYGLGCASFQSHAAGVWSSFATADQAEWGRSVSRFEIEYEKQPGGGALELSIDDARREQLSTDGDEGVAYQAILVPDGPHKLAIRSLDDRPARLFGVRMERDVPGVTLSACGITGARARFLLKQDEAHFSAVIAAAKPDLVALAFGSNEITDGTAYPIAKFEETLAEVMARVEKAAPAASWMLVGPPDMASQKASQGHSRPMVYFIVEAEKKLAAQRGWAFWDQYHAMGGGGSMWSWIAAGLGSEDMFHPTGKGGNVLGNFEYAALMAGYARFKAAHP